MDAPTHDNRPALQPPHDHRAATVKWPCPNDSHAAITELLLEDTRRRLAGQEITVEFTRAAVRRLAALGHQPEFGARPLRRTIQREIDNRLSELLLAGKVTAGSHVRVDAGDDDFALTVGDTPPAG